MRPAIERRLWGFVLVVAVAGLVYGVVEYIGTEGPWKALVMVPLMLLLGYLAVEILYPMWFRE